LRKACVLLPQRSAIGSAATNGVSEAAHQLRAVRQPTAKVDDPENADRALDPLRFRLLRFEAFEQTVEFATVDAEYSRGLSLVSILLIQNF